VSDSEQEMGPEEQVEDLDVPESESEDVKGGLSLNYSKVELSYATKVGPSVQKINPGGLNIDKV
jgi:hypothetical protein